MSVIKTETDRKGKTVTYATGIVDFVKLDKFDEPKTFHWDGKAIVSTHRASLAIKAKDAKPEDKGVWIGLGDIEIKEGFDEFEEFHIAYNSLINDAVLDNLFIDDHYSEDVVP